MPIDNQAVESVIQAFAQATGVPDGSVRFSSVERDNKAVITLQATKTDTEGSTTDVQLSIQETEKPHYWKLVGKVVSPNRNTEFEKIVVANPASQLAIFIKNVLLVSKVCKKSPHLINKIGNKIGSYI
jgi:hypothetical protein